jgi:hypothetical protein
MLQIRFIYIFLLICIIPREATNAKANSWPGEAYKLWSRHWNLQNSIKDLIISPDGKVVYFAILPDSLYGIVAKYDVEKDQMGFISPPCPYSWQSLSLSSDQKRLLITEDFDKDRTTDQIADKSKQYRLIEHDVALATSNPLSSFSRKLPIHPSYVDMYRIMFWEHWAAGDWQLRVLHLSNHDQSKSIDKLLPSFVLSGFSRVGGWVVPVADHLLFRARPATGSWDRTPILGKSNDTRMHVLTVNRFSGEPGKTIYLDEIFTATAAVGNFSEKRLSAEKSYFDIAGEQVVANNEFCYSATGQKYLRGLHSKRTQDIYCFNTQTRKAFSAFEVAESISRFAITADRQTALILSADLHGDAQWHLHLKRKTDFGEKSVDLTKKLNVGLTDGGYVRRCETRNLSNTL